MSDELQPLAFSPGSITCFFHVNRGRDARSTVSHGCAVNIAEGVTASIGESPEPRVTLNQNPIELPTVSRVVEELSPKPIAVHLETPLQIGCGFGVSAAAALASAFAIDLFFELHSDESELGLLAHVAEVECGTGVGDVAAQLCGGVVHRRCRTGPFDVEKLTVPATDLSYIVFGPLSTREVLRAKETVEAIDREGRLACAWLESQSQSQISLDAILRRSRQFSQAVGLLTPEVTSAIEAATAYEQEATMILLGQSVLACGGPPPAADWIATTIDELGTRRLQ